MPLAAENGTPFCQHVMLNVAFWPGAKYTCGVRVVACINDWLLSHAIAVMFMGSGVSCDMRTYMPPFDASVALRQENEAVIMHVFGVMKFVLKTPSAYSAPNAIAITSMTQP